VPANAYPLLTRQADPESMSQPNSSGEVLPPMAVALLLIAAGTELILGIDAEGNPSKALRILYPARRFPS
jgi:hypothetical protein